VEVPGGGVDRAGGDDGTQDGEPVRIEHAPIVRFHLPMPRKSLLVLKGDAEAR
jgi:hypothetical protein